MFCHKILIFDKLLQRSDAPAVEISKEIGWKLDNSPLHSIFLNVKINNKKN
jgi:hypothetical protein